MRHLARLHPHIESDDAEQHHEHQHGEQQVDRDARQQDDRALPKRQAAILLPIFAFEQRLGVLDRARLALSVALRRGLAGLRRRADLLLGGDDLCGAIRVVLVLLCGTGAASPVHQLIERLERILVGNAAIARDILHVRRAPTVQRRQRRLQMRAHLARLHAAHARITAQQNGRDAELRAPFLEADARARHAQHELGDAHAEGTRRQIVAAFVDDHQDAQHDGAIQNHEDDVQKRAPCLSCGHATKRGFA